MDETKIYDWINSITSLTTIRSNDDGPRPSGNFATWQVISSVPADYSDVTWAQAAYNVNYTHTRKYRVTVSVNIFASTGAALLNNLVQSNYKPSIRTLLTPAIVLLGAGQIQDLSRVMDTKFVPQYQADFNFAVFETYTYTEINSIVDDFTITGDVGDETVTIPAP